MAESLRQKGQKAKDRFIKLVTNVRRSNDFSSGDTEVNIDGVWYHVDVKDCTSIRLTKLSDRYQTLVIYFDGVWYVIPIKSCPFSRAKKPGTTHRNPFECAL